MTGQIEKTTSIIGNPKNIESETLKYDGMKNEKENGTCCTTYYYTKIDKSVDNLIMTTEQENMDDNIKEHILDNTVGNVDYWKKQFGFVLDDIQIHNPEMLVETCFCDDNKEFNSYRRWKDIYIDTYQLMEYIETSTFKEKMIHDVLEILSNMNHPFYDVIECELTRV